MILIFGRGSAKLSSRRACDRADFDDVALDVDRDSERDVEPDPDLDLDLDADLDTDLDGDSDTDLDLVRLFMVPRLERARSTLGRVRRIGGGGDLRRLTATPH